MLLPVIVRFLQIRKNIFKELSHHRSGDLASIICALGIVDDGNCHHLRIIGRSKSQKGRNISPASPGQRLACGSLSTYPVAFYLSILSSPFSTTCSSSIFIVSDVSALTMPSLTG